MAANSDALSTPSAGRCRCTPTSASTGYGIPYNVVDSTTPRKTVAFDYDDESDHVPYPIPGPKWRVAAIGTC